jgi:hypothetical protein
MWPYPGRTCATRTGLADRVANVGAAIALRDVALEVYLQPSMCWAAEFTADDAIGLCWLDAPEGFASLAVHDG